MYFKIKYKFNLSKLQLKKCFILMYLIIKLFLFYANQENYY